ncbi:MAG: small ribosomal subunit Rsm22 family protein, partial [Opitutales bacterium]
MSWENLDWEVLDRLRGTFLSEAKAGGPYWHTITDLECYDLTYAERIGWKWDAVLRELRRRGWTPCSEPGRTACSEPGRTACGEPCRTAGGEQSCPHEVTKAGLTVLDWGCGSGVAGRRVVEFFGAGNFSRLLLHDHSALAMDYAEHRGRQAFPALTVERASHRFRQVEPVDVLVVSHVLNELDDVARAELADQLNRARSVLWVEPGTHEVSRALVGWRERLCAAGAQPVAPCTHEAACGVLTAGNERHWCHFF